MDSELQGGLVTRLGHNKDAQLSIVQSIRVLNLRVLNVNLLHTEHACFLMGVFISQRRLDSCPLQMTPATCPVTAPTSRGAAAGRRDSQRAEQRV
ncbi:unnamed protein product [Boreogadus saida]